MNNDDQKIFALIADLDHSDKSIVRAAVNALIPLAENSEELKAKLTQQLHSVHRKYYWPVAYVLGHIPQPSTVVVQILLDTLDHRDPDIRWAVGLLLVRMAKTQKDLVKLLIDLCTTGTPTQKRMALYCLRDLELQDKYSLQALIERLDDGEAMVRIAAAISLAGRTDTGADGRKTLLRLFLNDPDLRVRNTAALTLARLGLPSGEFLRALEKARGSENAQIRKAAAAALTIIDKKRSAPTGS